MADDDIPEVSASSIADYMNNLYTSIISDVQVSPSDQVPTFSFTSYSPDGQEIVNGLSGPGTSISGFWNTPFWA